MGVPSDPGLRVSSGLSGDSRASGGWPAASGPGPPLLITPPDCPHSAARPCLTIPALGILPYPSIHGISLRPQSPVPTPMQRGTRAQGETDVGPDQPSTLALLAWARPVPTAMQRGTRAHGETEVSPDQPSTLAPPAWAPQEGGGSGPLQTPRVRSRSHSRREWVAQGSKGEHSKRISLRYKH